MKDIVLTTINAKWIHPSLALRLLKANLGVLEDRCEIIEFALRQPSDEKPEILAATQARIIGISVSVWNHTATVELLQNLSKFYLTQGSRSRFFESAQRPYIVLGGPEVSYLPSDAGIFKYADYVIRGEGETAFRELCEKLLAGKELHEKFIEAEEVDVTQIKTACHLYTDEDVQRKLIYVESTRGCPFGCEFCLSSIKENILTEAQMHRGCGSRGQREFPIEDFFIEMEKLIQRGVKTFKFLDRTFNANIKRAIQICEFFLEKLNDRTRTGMPSYTVHFEMVPTLFTPEIAETLACFPPGTLRLEIGIQTLNAEVAKRIKLPGRSGQACKTAEQILEPLRLLREKTNAIIHADLIAGLPGETSESFGNGFDSLWKTLSHGVFPKENFRTFKLQNQRHGGFEVQLGILKQLPGTPISAHNEEFNMRYSTVPPYEVLETSAMSAVDIAKIKNFARFWELLVNRRLLDMDFGQNESVFQKFMTLSDFLFDHFGKNWGINKEELLAFASAEWQQLTMPNRN